MGFEDTIIALGEFGRYQWLIYLAISTAILAGATATMSMVFTAPKTDHWCVSWPTETCETWGLPTYDCLITKRNISIPLVYDESTDLMGFDKCARYDTSDVLFDPSLNLTSHTKVACNEGWVYMSGRDEVTLINQFNLVCDKATFPEIAQSLYFLGFLIGSIGFGALSDRLGRKKAIFISFAMAGTSGVIAGLSPNYWFFATIRIFQGSAAIGATICIFVFSSEIVGPSKRAIAASFLWFYFAAGYVILALMSYIIPNWRVLMIILAIPYLLLLPFYFVVPESPRWLITKKRFKEAEVILKRMAAFNKKSLPVNFMRDIIDEEEGEEKVDVKQGTFLDLFRSSILRYRMINLMFNWLVQSLVYYGLSLSTADLGVNNYIAFSISGLIEFPGYLVSMYLPNWCGRRYSLIGTMFTGGVACLLTILIPPGYVRTAVAMVGKFGITVSFAIVYLLTAEVLPTPLRNVGLGSCSMSSRIGGILSPMIILLKNLWEPLPLIIMGSSSLIAGALVYFLPETKGQSLPQTIEDAENIGRDMTKLEEGAVNGLNNGTDERHSNGYKPVKL